MCKSVHPNGGNMYLSALFFASRTLVNFSVQTVKTERGKSLYSFWRQGWLSIYVDKPPARTRLNAGKVNRCQAVYQSGSWQELLGVKFVWRNAVSGILFWRHETTPDRVSSGCFVYFVSCRLVMYSLISCVSGFSYWKMQVWLLAPSIHTERYSTVCRTI